MRTILLLLLELDTSTLFNCSRANNNYVIPDPGYDVKKLFGVYIERWECPT